MLYILENSTEIWPFQKGPYVMLNLKSQQPLIFIGFLELPEFFSKHRGYRKTEILQPLLIAGACEVHKGYYSNCLMTLKLSLKFSLGSLTKLRTCKKEK